MDNDIEVGFTICTQGEAKILMKSLIYTLKKGTLYIKSSVVFSQLLEQSDDFQCISILAKTSDIYSVFKQVIDVVSMARVIDAPIINLDEKMFEDFMKRAGQIQKYKENEQSDDSHKALLNKLLRITLMQNTVLVALDYYYNNVEQQRASFAPVRFNDTTLKFILLLSETNGGERNVSYFADKANLTTGHFSRVILKNTGRSAKDWIDLFVVNRAKELLRNKDLIIKEIAEEMAFPEQFTFRKYFKKYTGMSPSEFREKQK